MHLLKYPSEKQTDGYTLLTEPDQPAHEGVTLMCRHCQYHWQVRPNSGIQRGWCHLCQGPTCGKRQFVEECVPWEKMLERIEARDRLDRAIAGARAL